MRTPLDLKEFCKNNYVVAGTGTRNLPDSAARLVTNLFRKLAELKTQHSNIIVCSGGAQGFDTLIARSAEVLDIPYVLCLPSPDYSDYYWGPRGSIDKLDHRDEFQKLLDLAQAHEFVMPNPKGKNGVYGHSNFDRNQRMVDISNEMIVFESSSPGTRDCVKRIVLAKREFTVVSNDSKKNAQV